MLEQQQLQIIEIKKYYLKIAAAPSINFISEINNTQIDDAQDIDIVMSMYNLIGYSDILFRKHQEVYGNTIEMNQL